MPTCSTASPAVTNPARGDVIANVANLTRAETARAIDAAYTAQRDWARWTSKERGAVLRRWFDLMVENADDLDAAVEGAMISKYRNNGQTCVCTNRLYFQSGV